MNTWAKYCLLSLGFLLPSLLTVVTLQLRTLLMKSSDGASLRQTNSSSLTIVAARCSEDVSWLSVHLGDMHHIVYETDKARAGRHAQNNKGNEAMPYLQYIIDNYDRLPQHSVFSHGAKYCFWSAVCCSPAHWCLWRSVETNATSVQRLLAPFGQSESSSSPAVGSSRVCKPEIRQNAVP